MKRKIAYLGPSGTYCEEAARIIIASDDSWQLTPCSSIDGVFEAVESGMAARGVVPIENSCEGSVNITLDLLAYEYRLQITGEVILPVKHNLLARHGLRIEDITTVLSHPQALAQCRKYLARKLGETDSMEIPSTADAACRVSVSDMPWAAIGTQVAARSYGLEILEQEIQDRSDNETRFISLGQSGVDYSPAVGTQTMTDSYKTSMIMAVGHHPGALFKALEQFYLHNINMSKIESRPAKKRIGNYLFFIDIDGHRMEPHINRAIEGLLGIVDDLRWLGSYPTGLQSDCFSDASNTRPVVDSRSICL